MTKKLILLSLTLSALLLTGCPAPQSDHQTISLKGSDTMVQLGQRWAELYMTEHPDVTIQVTAGGTGNGIAALIDGTTQICQASRAMKDAEKESLKTKRNLEAVASALPTPHAALQIEVHTDLAIGGLKYSGNSHRRQRNFLLFHGTFLLNFDLTLVNERLHPPSLQPAYRQSRPHGEFVTNLNCASATVKSALAATWGASGTYQDLSIDDIKSLAQTKYEQHDWNFKF